MAVIRGDDADVPYVRIRNATARDVSLSYEARGMLVQILSHSPGWKINEKELMRSGNTGRDRVRRMLKELVEAGYAVRVKPRDDETGEFLRTDWEVYGYPRTENPSVAEPRINRPLTENPAPDNPSTDNPAPENTSYKNKRVVRTKEVKNGHPFEVFWAGWLKRRKRKDAEKAWAKLTPEQQDLAIKDSQSRWATDPDWLKDDCQYAPLPATYLNGEQWDDEWQTPEAKPRQPTRQEVEASKYIGEFEYNSESCDG